MTQNWRERERGRGWAGPWPGKGPFSYLPPWQRPGWLYRLGGGFGRRCWCWAVLHPHSMLPMSKEDELKALEEYRKVLETQKLNIEDELKNIETRIRKMKTSSEQYSKESESQ